MSDQALICRAGGLVCAFPISGVSETMRPLAIEPLAEVPAFVLGLSIIRGVPTPVIDLAELLGSAVRTPPTRFVTLNTGVRRVAVAVDTVVGIQTLLEGELLPPLLQSARSEAIAAIGASDRQLQVVLEAARIVPESLWPSLSRERA